MPNTGLSKSYFQTGNERASRVRQLFDHIAPRYDLVNDVQSFGLHRSWKRTLAACANLRAGQAGLDLCCGTGDVVFALRGKGTCVTGVDFSLRMLEVAVQRASASKSQMKEAQQPLFLASDALRLPFQDESFDAVTISYGLRNLASYETGLKEMVRVLRPGGIALVMDFGKPDFVPWRAAYFLYLRCAVPFFGWLFHRNAAAYAYILESLNHYPAQHGVAAIMRELGLQNVQIKNFLGGVTTINSGQKH